MARSPDIQYIRFQTDGNAARKVEVAAPIKTLRLPRAKAQLKPKVLRIDPLALTAILMVIVMASLMFVGVAQLNAAQQQTIAMQTHVKALESKNETLRSNFEKDCDLDEIERTAMALGMVPAERVTHISVRVPQQTIPQQPGAWERITMFLTGLFA